MTKDKLYTLLKEKLGDFVELAANDTDLPTCIVDVQHIYQAIALLKDEHGFVFLTDVCGIHYTEQLLPLGVIYHLHNFKTNERIRLKTFVSAESPIVPTLTSLFESANWMERETYDFYGIVFDGHPNLKRILNVEYLDFYPMRKEYKLEDPTREDKDNRFFGR